MNKQQATAIRMLPAEVKDHLNGVLRLDAAHWQLPEVMKWRQVRPVQVVVALLVEASPAALAAAEAIAGYNVRGLPAHPVTIVLDLLRANTPGSLLAVETITGVAVRKLPGFTGVRPLPSAPSPEPTGPRLVWVNRRIARPGPRQGRGARIGEVFGKTRQKLRRARLGTPVRRLGWSRDFLRAAVERGWVRVL